MSGLLADWGGIHPTVTWRGRRYVADVAAGVGVQ